MAILTQPGRAIGFLENGELDLKGEFVWGSNYTFLIDVVSDGETIKAVYKPIKGEQPLWDFSPSSLAKREVAAYLVSEALNWHLVPPTIYRQNAPYGPGSLQLFIEHDPQYHYYNFTGEDKQRLRPVVVFDILINNADRKGSHILFDNEKQTWLIDHGVCFHEEEKLRTVVWDFVGEDIPPNILADVENFVMDLESNNEIPKMINLIKEYLSPGEINMLAKRGKKLIEAKSFPFPSENRRQFPWPLI